ncbi:MAG: iron-sulfur cluster assembly scaffold protein [Planctomycetota bacterium]
MADAPSGGSPAYLDHARAPRAVGEVARTTHAADVEDAVCGDRLALSLRVEGGAVVEARQRVTGCHGAVAAGSALATLLPGREARPDAVTAADLDAALGGVPGAKRHALRLATDALRAALHAPPAPRPPA